MGSGEYIDEGGGWREGGNLQYTIHDLVSRVAGWHGDFGEIKGCGLCSLGLDLWLVLILKGPAPLEDQRGRQKLVKRTISNGVNR